MLQSRRSFLTQCAAGSTILVAGARNATSAATPAAIRVGVIGGDFAAQPYFANDMGFFEKAGLKAEITEFNNGPAIAAAIAGGALDVGYSNVISLVIAHDKGLPFTIIAGAYIYRPSTATTGLLSVLKTSTIQNAKDFTGKTIAVGALYNVTDLATRAWIDNNGGDSTSVHFVEMPASAFTEAIKSGRIDAAPIDASLDPQLGKAGSSLRLVGKAFDSIGSNYTVGGWFTTKDWVIKNGAEAKAFSQAMKSSAQWANTHAHESAAVLAKYLKTDQALIESLPRVGYSTSITPAAIQGSIDVAARYKVIRAAFSAKDLIDSAS
jgi:NitT/TauT family transport system substrate-binding protein